MLRRFFAAVLAVCACPCGARGAELVEHPFLGITTIARTETTPRNLTIHVV